MAYSKKSTGFIERDGSESNSNKICTQQTHARILGPLERSFYFWTLKCDDTFPYKMSLSSKYPFTVKHVSDAISSLVKQHQVLCKSFVDTGSKIELIETSDHSNHLEILPKTRFYSIFNEFSLNGKLCRFILLEPAVNCTHTIEVMIAVHHALADYIYNREIIRTFVNNLHLLQLGKKPLTDIEFNLTMPIEEITKNVAVKDIQSYRIDRRFVNKKVSTAVEILSRSIQKLSQLKCPCGSSRTIRWSLDKNETRSFLVSRRKCNGSINALILSVCITSFMKLISGSHKQDEIVDLSFSFMVNLRRYILNREEFRGNASIDVHFFLQIDTPINSDKQFWLMADEISEKIREIIDSAGLLTAAEDWVDMPREIIALTHVGSIDNFLEDETTIRLEDLQVNVNANQDLSALFHVITYFSRGEMHFCIAYGSSFIPDQFAQVFVNGINETIQHIVNVSKL
ncbi:unnamed protein product [Mytilus coruscus]|uniref:Condensation domain-containing protein n=1 Tax=Mytilus coruscus TaxID=42192 RepID=A0A6J8EM92_MYTCO|nr:unnamed protein product [Mytilus coruscus]